MMPCVSEPVSWLRLERLRLGEISVAEQTEIETHLSACEACRAAYAHTGESVELLPLPLLPAGSSRPSVFEVLLARVREHFALYGFALAAAVALLVVVQTRDPGVGPGLEPPDARIAVKGGELAIELVRRSGGVDRAPTHFAPGDAWKVLLTCPPSLEGTVDVVVYQDERAYFPLPAGRLAQCGNRIALPGAFSLSGDTPAVVCAVLGGAASVDRRALAHPERGLPKPSVCERVLPAERAEPRGH